MYHPRIVLNITSKVATAGRERGAPFGNQPFSHGVRVTRCKQPRLWMEMLWTKQFLFTKNIFLMMDFAADGQVLSSQQLCQVTQTLYLNFGTQRLYCSFQMQASHVSHSYSTVTWECCMESCIPYFWSVSKLQIDLQA